MRMTVRTVNGKRYWSFTVDEVMLYNLVCTQIAWRVLKKTGKPIDQVEANTVSLAENGHKRTDEEINGISDIFIRAVMQERKRLNLTEYQLQLDDEDKGDSREEKKEGT